MVLTEEDQIVPQPQEETAQKKKISQKKLENANLWPRIKFSIN